ncbi:lipopolysaccharide biosynthesis protein [Parahaliea mediterranea]|uniref:lipopolysaccharide biosynthesis protein n=1 Tax=Parahaliea mediterranea TaxID=651086 RepID=UPI0013008D21|nr:oligosaccharide flippase family protein [Parahaliea mediterranea]
MALRTNTLANYAGTAYSAIIAVLVVPLYFQHLGPEAYGLVGFFSLAQAWLNVLDLGLSQLTARTAATKGYQEPQNFVLLVKSLELVFFVVFLCISGFFFFGGKIIAEEWLIASNLDLNSLTDCLALIGATIGLRLWMSLYKSTLVGLERQIILNIMISISSTARYPGSLVLLTCFTTDVVVFFYYQLAISAIELLLLAVISYRQIPKKMPLRPLFSLPSVMEGLPFAGTIAFSSLVSILLVQFDKLIFSKTLTLAEFGYLSAATFITTAIFQAAGPISQALLPRLTALFSSGEEAGFRAAYLNGAELFCIVIAPVTFTIAIFSQPLLQAWTGSYEAGLWGKDILFWYALGSGTMALSSFHYFLQYVHGKMRLHVIWLSFSALLQTPVLASLAISGNVKDAALTWFLFRIADVLLWSPYIHKVFAPGLYHSLLFRFLKPISISIIVLIFLQWWIGSLDGLSRPMASFTIVSSGCIALLFCILLSPFARHQIKQTIGFLNYF